MNEDWKVEVPGVGACWTVWSPIRVADLPVKTQGFLTLVVGGKILVVGGKGVKVDG